MSIQESINKTLGIGAVLATQSPLMEKQKIKSAKASEIRRLNTQAKMLEKKVEADTPSSFDVGVSIEAHRQLREVNRRLFELNPTHETSANYYGTIVFNNFHRMNDANAEANNKRFNKKTQKQAFKVLKESKKNGKT